MIKNFDLPKLEMCCRCANKSFTGCSICRDYSNFEPTCTYEEYKQRRKEETRKKERKK